MIKFPIERLLNRIKEFTDPRSKHGKRHSLETVLSIVVCAVLCGCKGYRAIGAWPYSLADVQPNAGLNWHVAGTGDFNKDGHVDLIMRNYADGRNKIWYMNGVVRTGYTELQKLPDLNWKIVNNGNGSTD